MKYSFSRKPDKNRLIIYYGFDYPTPMIAEYDDDKLFPLKVRVGHEEERFNPAKDGKWEYLK